MYVWGFQETGALGLQTNIRKAQERYTQWVHHPSRMQFSVNNDITNVAAGYGFTVFAVQRSDGETLFGTGINSDSQLGFQVRSTKDVHHLKNLDVIIYPTAIRLPRVEGETDKDMRISLMAAGRAHLIVKTENGMIFTLGNNAYGQCARSIIENEEYRGNALIHRIPEVDICGPDDKIVDIICGQDHTMFLTTSGHVYSCGWGADGQTGKGHYDTNGCIERVLGDIATERIIKLACSSDCVLALSESGEVFGWGNTEYGQLHNNSTDIYTQVNSPMHLTLARDLSESRWIDVAAGGSFCMLLNEQGHVYTWGYGILGFGPAVEQTSRPQQLLPALFGCNEFNDKSYVKSIGCGIFHMGAINTEGDLFMWGKNRFGHLGLGHKKDQYFPFKTSLNAKVTKVVFGVDHTVALCEPFI